MCVSEPYEIKRELQGVTVCMMGGWGGGGGGVCERESWCCFTVFQRSQ